MTEYKIVKTYRNQIVSEETRDFKSLLSAKRNAPEILSNQEVISIYQNGLLVARKRIDAKRAHWI